MNPENIVGYFFYDWHFRIGFILNISHQLFDDVFQRQQAHNSTKFVDHYRHLIFLLLKLAQNLADFFAGGNKQQLSGHAAQGPLSIATQGGQQIFGQDEPKDIVHVFFVYRIARIPLLDGVIDGIIDGHGHIDGRNLIARFEHLAYCTVVEVKYILNEFTFRCPNGSSFGTFGNDEFQLIFRVDFGVWYRLNPD